jgi:hypothetical protein
MQKIKKESYDDSFLKKYEMKSKRKNSIELPHFQNNSKIKYISNDHYSQRLFSFINNKHLLENKVPQTTRNKNEKSLLIKENKSLGLNKQNTQRRSSSSFSKSTYTNSIYKKETAISESKNNNFETNSIEIFPHKKHNSLDIYLKKTFKKCHTIHLNEQNRSKYIKKIKISQSRDDMIIENTKNTFLSLNYIEKIASEIKKKKKEKNKINKHIMKIFIKSHLYEKILSENFVKKKSSFINNKEKIAQLNIDFKIRACEFMKKFKLKRKQIEQKSIERKRNLLKTLQKKPKIKHEENKITSEQENLEISDIVSFNNYPLNQTIIELKKEILISTNDEEKQKTLKMTNNFFSLFLKINQKFFAEIHSIKIKKQKLILLLTTKDSQIKLLAAYSIEENGLRKEASNIDKSEKITHLNSPNFIHLKYITKFYSYVNNKLEILRIIDGETILQKYKKVNKSDAISLD